MEFNKPNFGFVADAPTAKRKGLKRHPFARFGLPGKRYKRKARSGACAGCAQYKGGYMTSMTRRPQVSTIRRFGWVIPAKSSFSAGGRRSAQRRFSCRLYSTKRGTFLLVVDITASSH
jgi:hypothetical protein